MHISLFIYLFVVTEWKIWHGLIVLRTRIITNSTQWYLCDRINHLAERGDWPGPLCIAQSETYSTEEIYLSCHLEGRHLAYLSHTNTIFISCVRLEYRILAYDICRCNLMWVSNYTFVTSSSKIIQYLFRSIAGACFGNANEIKVFVKYYIQT